MKTRDLDEQSLLLMLGLPGSGKSFFARQFALQHNVLHLSFNKIKDTFFGKVEIDTHDENRVILIMMMMLEDAMEQGRSVIFDAPLYSRAQRKDVRDAVKKFRAKHLIVWVQTDPSTAFDRAIQHDGRNPEGKYASDISAESFYEKERLLKKPLHEDYVVISGKHVFVNQSRAVHTKLVSMDIIKTNAQHKKSTVAAKNILPRKGARITKRVMEPTRQVGEQASRRRTSIARRVIKRSR